MKITKDSAIYFVLLLTPLFWGGAFGSTKHVLSELPPLTITITPMHIAGMVLVISGVCTTTLAPTAKSPGQPVEVGE